MHGLPRKVPTAEEAAASAVKAEKLRCLQSQVLSNHHHKIYTKEAVEASAKLLETNPECYTAWNYRKLAVQHNLSQSDSDPDIVKSILDQELRVVESALRQNFKSYGAWHHRKWVLCKGHSSIDKELKLLDKLFTIDSRNFHAWSYRRFVAQLMNRSEKDELDYTECLIGKNFSNYSAWHNRSFLLSNLVKKSVEGFSEKNEVLTREYELVRDAVFTDQDDQSGWFYHLWLLKQTVNTEGPMLVSSWPAHRSDIILLIDSCLEDCASSPFSTFQFDSGTFPLILFFNQAVEGINSSTVKVASGFNSNEDLTWKPVSTHISQAAQVWVTELSFPDVNLHSLESYPVEVSFGQYQGIVSSTGSYYSHPSHLAFTVRVQSVKTGLAEGASVARISWTDNNFHLCEPHLLESDLVASLDNLSIKSKNEPAAATWQEKIIAEEIKLFRELSDCKIGKLTLARLLSAHDALVSSDKSAHSEEVLRLYCQLIKLDPTHARYYKDVHSLALLQQVTSSQESVLSRCFHYRDLTSLSSGYPICLRLNNLSLSRIGAVEKLLWVQMLDLSCNELQSIEGLEAMQLLSYLSLSRNKLSSFTSLEPLRQLKSLKMLDISYNEIGLHSIDTTRYLCSSPLSHSVGNEWEQDKTVIYGIDMTNYWEAFFVLKGLNLTQLDVLGNAIADEKFTSFLVKVLPKLKWLDGVKLN
ncbi:geranylgeranyl transferase type-2 subunit alpha 1 [Ricinus communis]|uniref:geranylgeranyl transferase type-2 subunit alpha 1 n=1 Tax=Ricinus communis TaxID=3988 RepID=UPI00201AC5C5|nr:geranylgeranyl transferase type-2 subunit alpha 1 [Ricinus communis]XP_015571478.2 geranylgeranyl transferase type-2 subunit alpha 1 [Ricinus communis]XP_048226689.1 geranylgeranyl transferase type-2 subunit alpha 1 [Ricinus communis]